VIPVRWILVVETDMFNISEMSLLSEIFLDALL